jgi:hypothetical protein
MAKIDYSKLDDAICEFIANSYIHPKDSDGLEDMATAFVFRKFARGLIESRMKAMRKAGRIKYVGNGKNNSSGKSHGWVVCIPDQSPTGEG